MKVSVILPVYNAAPYLAQAIESILAQSFTDFELIIINDGSNDSSLQIIQSFHDRRIVLLNQDNQGISSALNNGIKVANGEYIARLDADDVAIPERLRKQVEILDTHPHLVLLGSNAILIDAKGNHLFHTKLVLDDAAIRAKLPDSSFFHSAVMFRRATWKLAGGYREDIVQHFEDKLLWNEMSKHGKLMNLEEPLILYRLHPYSVSNLEADGYRRKKIISDQYADGKDFNHKEWLEFLQKTDYSDRQKKTFYFDKLASIYLGEAFNRKKALLNLIKSLSLSPFYGPAVRKLFIILLPRKTILKLRHLKTN